MDIIDFSNNNFQQRLIACSLDEPFKENIHTAFNSSI